MKFQEISDKLTQFINRYNYLTEDRSANVLFLLTCVVLKYLTDNLRIDFEDDDTLLLSLISTAKQLVMDVGRMDEERFSENEDVVRTAMLYTVSYLYENRNTADFSKLTLTLRAMLFAQREGVV